MIANESPGQFSVSSGTEQPQDDQPKPADVSASLRRTNRELLNELRGQMSALRQQHARFHVLLGSPAPMQAEDPGERTWPQFGLTGREIEVARLLSEGRRNAAIAVTLGISPHTARHHTQRVLAKLGVHSRAEAGAKLRD